MVLGRLPQLNTGGGDYSNALQGIIRADTARRANEDRETAAGQRNKLLALQQKKLESDLDPEVVELKRKMAKLKLDTDNAMLLKKRLENRAASAKFVRDRMAPFLKDQDPSIKGYSAMYNNLLKDPDLGPHVKAYAPNPDNFLKPNISGDGSMIVSKEDRKLFNQQLSGIIVQADSKAKNQPGGKSVTLYGPKDASGNPRTMNIWIPKGEGYVPPENWSLSKPAAEKEPKQGKVETATETKDGQVYEVTYFRKPNGKKVEESRVLLSDITKAKAKDPVPKDAKAVTREEIGDDGEIWKVTGHFVGEEWKEDSRVPLKSVVKAGTKDTGKGELTGKQAADIEARDKKNLLKLGDTVMRDPEARVNKEESAEFVRQYNELAEKTGSPSRIAWSEDAGVEVDGESKWYLPKFMEGKDKVPGYVAVKAVEGTDPEGASVTETPEPVDGLETAPTATHPKLTEDLMNQLREAYPDRSDEELIRAYEAGKAAEAGGI